MTDRKQFKAMLEALINEDQETAKDIFHNIVVAKSREIYEELLSEDFDLEEAKDEDEEEAKRKKDQEEVDESFDEAADDEADMGDEEGEEGDEGDVGGDATDDLVGDVSDDAGSEEGDMSDEEQSDRILDLEDALEELKAEFEQLMAGEGEPEGDMGADIGADMGGDNMDDMLAKEMGAMPVMEYKHKVTAKMGDNGANAKSVVAGKNDMGGTTANIAKGGTEPDSSSTKGGLLNPSTKEDNAGNVNVPGGNKVKLSPVSGGHGAEKKGKGESADNKKSIIGGK